MTFKEKITTETFDYNTIEAGYYDRAFKRGFGIQSKWHRLKFAFVRDRLGKYESLLDLGCGPGTFIGNLPTSSSLRVGVDVAPSQIEYARQNYGEVNRQFICADISGKLPFSDASFDVVTLIEAVEHFPEQQIVSILSEIKRVLKPGGRLIVTTPNYKSLWPFVEWVLNRISVYSHETQHLEQFNDQRLHDFLAREGFTNIAVESFLRIAPFTAPVGWALADRLDAWEARRKIFPGLLLCACATKGK